MKENTKILFTLITCFVVGGGIIASTFKKEDAEYDDKQIFDEPPTGGDNNTNATIPEPATEGFILDPYDTSQINVSVNQSHFHFTNSYINESLEHIDVFLPESLKDDITYVTPCDPNLMECQGPNGYFHILNDWTNQYSDRFYIETDYLFDYKQPYGDPDDDIPEGFGYTRINQNITVNYTENDNGIGDLLNTIVSIDGLHSIQINVSSNEHNLILNYTYFYNDEIVAYFEDSYCSYEPPLNETVIYTGDNDSFYAEVEKNSSNMTLFDNVNKTHFLSVGLDNGLPNGWSIENTTFTQEYSDSNISFYPCVVDNTTCLEFLLELQSQPESNTINFGLNHSLDVFGHEGGFVFNDVFTAPSNSFGAISFNNTVFQVFRPVIIDANDDSVYGDLSIVNDELILSIPQSFLDSANYPIKVDPTFGNENTGGYTVTADNRMSGIWSTMGGTSGYADNISVYIKPTGGDITIYGAIYEYIDYSTSYAGDLIGTTDSLSVSQSSSYSWYTMDFPDSTTSLDADTKYYILLRIPEDSSTYWHSESGGDGVYEANGGESWEDPWNGESSSSYFRPIYCSYTEGSSNTAPTITGETPSNQSTDISLQPTVNVTVSDADSDSMTCNFYTSSNGADWTHQQTNSTVSTGTSISYDYTGASSYSTKYYWKVTADDGTDNTTSDIYEFTTGSAPNNAPSFSSEDPTDTDTGVSVSKSTVSVTINDADGDTFDWNIDVSTGDTNSGNTASNGSKSCSLTTPLDYNTEYTWWVNATDGTDATNESYTFTTEADSVNPTGSIDAIDDNIDLYNITGSASDADSGVASVDIQIYDEDDTNYWTGADWGAQTWLDCTGTTSWYYTGIGACDFDSDHNITITLRVYDSESNVDSSADTESFTTISCLFCNGFEEGDFSEWDGDTTGSGATMTVVSDEKRSGDYSAYFSTPAGSWATIYEQLPSSYSEIYVREYVKLNTTPASGDAVTMMGLFAGSPSDANTIAVAGLHNDGGTPYWMVKWRDGSSLTKTITSTEASAGNYRELQLRAKVHNSEGEIQLWVDGVIALNLTGKDTNNIGDISHVSAEGGTWGEGSAAEDWVDDYIVSESYIGTPLDVSKPEITWESPTPTDGDTQESTEVTLNTTTSDDNQISAFFDWNESLILYWSMDSINATGVFDNSTYNNFGTYNNASNIEGKYGNATDFTGNTDESHMYSSDTEETQIDDELSIDLWVLPGADQEDGTNYGVAGAVDGAHSTSHWSWQLRYGAPTNSSLGFQLNTAGGSEWVDVGYNLSETEWTHIVVTANSTTEKLYVNGILTDTNTYSETSIDTYTDTKIILGSAGWGSAGVYYTGKVDEFKLFDRVLSHDEINASYNNTDYRLQNTFSGLSYDTYNYSAYAIDESGNLNITTQRNITIQEINTAPSINSNTPANQSSQQPPGLTCNVAVTDADGDNLDVSFATNATGAWEIKQTNSTVSNGTYYWDFTDASENEQKYYWRVYVDDGTENVSETYWFTTGEYLSWYDNDFGGSERWLDVANNSYASSYQSADVYNDSLVYIDYTDSSTNFEGTLYAQNLKPNFAYQLKLIGVPGTDANERIGYAGRWWEQEWTGSSWTTGSNLNSKGDGTSPNPNDETYEARKDVVDATSPTGLNYKYTGYLPFVYFITDSDGDATVSFYQNMTYHVVWKTSQRAHSDGNDGPLISSTFDPSTSSDAYDTDYGESTITVFGEWERLPNGSIYLEAGDYVCDVVLTEESFHGDGGTGSGSWINVMNESVDFAITNTVPTIDSKTPANGSTDISLTPECTAYINESNVETLNITFASNHSGSWVNYHTNNSVYRNTEPSYTFTGFSDYSTTYYWKVYADDGVDNVSEIYHFTTEANPRSWQQVESGWFSFTSTDRSFQDVETGWFTFTSTDRSFQTIESGWFSFDATDRSYQNIDSGWFSFDSTERSFQTVESGWFSFSNSASFQDIDSGWFSFSNTASYQDIDTGWFSFTAAGSYQTVDEGYFTFSSTSRSFQTTESGWFTFSNSSSFDNIESGWFTFSNSGSFQNIDSGWFSFSNSSSYKDIDSGWFSFSNTATYQSIDDGWFTFSNTVTYSTIESGWFTITSEDRAFQTVESGWFSFDSEDRTFQNIESGWFTIDATDRAWQNVEDGWFSFTSTDKSLQTVEEGWFSFNSTDRTFQTTDSGWFSFNSTDRSWQTPDDGWFTFNSVTRTNQTIEDGWFSFSNVSSFKTIESGWFSFRNTSMIYGTPTPGNGTATTSYDLTWEIELLSPVGDTFDWNISCSNGVYDNDTADSNGTKGLTLSSLSAITTYTIWVNTTHRGNTISHWYTFSTPSVKADFTYTIEGNKVKITSTSTPANNSDMEYNWKHEIDNGYPAETGYCNQDEITITLPEGGVLELWLSIQYGSITDTKKEIIDGIDDTRDILEPSEYDKESECTEDGYYWYNGSCHEEEETDPWNEDQPTKDPGEDDEPVISWGEFSVHPGILVLFIIAAVVSYLFLYRRKKKNDEL